jgi:mono/diheme cytochrome c family protein
MTSRNELAAVLAAAALAAGCGRGMEHQPKVRTLEPSSFFADGRSARPRVPDTVARGRLGADELLETGRSGGRDADLFPFPIGRAELERGRQRFDIYCADCHGRDGGGDGMVVRRGFPRPPSFEEPRLRAAAAGHFVAVMSEGFGKMYPFADRVSARDRWMVAAYIRVLQLSRGAPLADAPPEERARLEASR